MRDFRPGMRVVVKDGPWPNDRIAGHYGKVTRVIDIERVQVDITGHIAGHGPMLSARDIGLVDGYFVDELDVVD